MQTSSFVIPTFRGMTLVGTALSTREDGVLEHALTTDTTAPDVDRVVYQIRSSDPVSREAQGFVQK